MELKQHWETGIEISFKNRKKKKTKPLLFPSVSYRKLKFLFWWWLKQHRCFSHTSIISLSNLMQSFKFIYILFFVFWILSPSSLCNFLTLNFFILKFPSWFAYIFIFLFFIFYNLLNGDLIIIMLMRIKKCHSFFILIKLFQWRHIIVHDTKSNDSFKADRVGGSKKLHKETFIINSDYRKLRSFQRR